MSAGRDALREQLEEQTEAEAATQGLQAGHERSLHRDASEQRQLVELLTEKDLSGSLPRKTYQLLEGLLSKTFPLGNLSAAQIKEHKFRLLIDRERFYAMHPRSDSELRGATRAWAHDDPDAYREPLNQEERYEVDTVFKNAEVALTPAEDFKQQEIFATSISESRVERGDTQQEGGLLSRLRGG